VVFHSRNVEGIVVAWTVLECRLLGWHIWCLEEGEVGLTFWCEEEI
jgi:hypothetical protein